jgi:hypothetical protein
MDWKSDKFIVAKKLVNKVMMRIFCGGVGGAKGFDREKVIQQE